MYSGVVCYESKSFKFEKISAVYFHWKYTDFCDLATSVKFYLARLFDELIIYITKY